MSLIEGSNLNRCKLESPGEVLDEILVNLAKAYKIGIIHSDLSEFNIMIEDSNVILIDWPQWVETSHQNAAVILERDISNIVTYFKRKYMLDYGLEDAVRCVIG